MWVFILKTSIRSIRSQSNDFFVNHFLDENKSKKYPNIVERSEPVNTPILTPSIYSKLFTKAKFPTNKLIVNPIPVKIESGSNAKWYKLV